MSTVVPRAGESATESSAEEAATVTVVLEGRSTSVSHSPGETLLETARRAGLTPPYSCEKGNCGSCIARLTEGHATMRINEVLDAGEIADGYVLTCQAIPDTDRVCVDYE